MDAFGDERSCNAAAERSCPDIGSPFPIELGRWPFPLACGGAVSIARMGRGPPMGGSRGAGGGVGCTSALYFCSR